MTDDIRNPRPGMVVRDKSGKNVYRVVEMLDWPESRKPVPYYVVRPPPKISTHVRYERWSGGGWYGYPPGRLSTWRRRTSGGELLPDDWQPPKVVSQVFVSEPTLDAVRSALAFYADARNHESGDGWCAYAESEVEADNGRRAREALALLEGVS